ncbi:MAG: hypothetical protein CL927_19470 [Deltaproteobacteria bacterium]|nr:hypothetical protein [Deltaproteobacteria bacterium]
MHADDDRWLDFLELHYRKQDLFTIEADALAIPVNVVLNLNYTLGKKLAQLGGRVLVERVQAAKQAIPGARMTLGTATSIPIADLPLQAKRAVLVAWWNETTDYDQNHLFKCYAAALRAAFAHGATSLVLPILGGRGGVKSTDRARVICDLLQQFNQLKPSGTFPVEHLIFADLNAAPLDAIERELDRNLYRD